MIDVFATLFPHPWVALALAAIAGASGPALTKLSAGRTIRQPLALELEAETSFLVGVLANLRRLPYVVAITPDDFAAGVHHRVWAALLAACPECDGLPDDPDEEACAGLGDELQARRDEILAQVWDTLMAGPTPNADGVRFKDLLKRGTDTIDDSAVVEAGHQVLYAGQDRNRTAGSGLVLETATPDSADPKRPPIARSYVAPSTTRTLLASVAAVTAAAFIPAFVSDGGFTGLGAVLAGGALGSLIVLSLVISLVDLDTFYVDVRTFLIGGSAAWALTIGADLANGTLSRVTGGLIIVAATAALFEISNRLYRMVRGVDGQGLGDSLIVLATVAIPPALTGNWVLGYYSVMAGMLLAVAGWVIGYARGKLTRETPYAFGPYLSAGWVVGWLVALTV